MSMLRTLCDERHPDQGGEVGFLNYARSPELALYDAELEQLAARHGGVRVARGFTRDEGAGAISGRFRPEHLGSVISEHRDAATFVCGPPALIEAVRAAWAAEVLEEPAVETFAPPTFAPGAGEIPAGGTIRFAGSGREVTSSGLPLLEQAEDAGLTPEYGCRMGICNTCSCRKTSGTVRNLLSGETSSKDGEPIRICVSVPVGDVELEL
jgi:ferredoxin-NADP reductase